MQAMTRRVHEAIGGGLADSAAQLRQEAARLLAVADELDSAARWLGPDVTVDTEEGAGSAAVEELTPVGAVEASASSGAVVGTSVPSVPDSAYDVVAEYEPRDGRHLAVAIDARGPLDTGADAGIAPGDGPSTALSRATPGARPWRPDEGPGHVADLQRDGRHGPGLGAPQASTHWDASPSTHRAWDR